ncbi:Subtilisin-like protease SBT1.8 [Bienertia sinuspersici]
MEFKFKIYCLFFFILCLTSTSSSSSSSSMRKTYIVHMNHQQKPSIYDTHHEWYSSNLQSLASFESLSSSDSSSPSLLYSYDSAYSGFAATLTPSEVESLRQNDAVFGVYEDTLYTLHTTRTPEFLGLDVVGEGLSSGDHLDTSDVIVGVLDTGIWPESKSFDDFDMPPVPTRWKGQCEVGPQFSHSCCNKKLIGARSFSHGFKMASGGGILNSDDIVSPRDTDGHGTHTASTAAGGHVSNASLLGYASGTARGMAPRARVAAYKVCFKTGCFGSDILAGIDKAISDGVDVLSLSLGGGSAPYFRDTIAIGAFAAMEKGVFVSCSAGNSGPTKASLANTAPWIMTVGAGTLDRDFPAFAILGNGKKFTGVSLYSGKGMGKKSVGLVYGGIGRRNGSSNLCMPGSLDPNLVKGKVVLCDRGVNPRVEKGEVVKQAGGVGMIMANTAASGEEMVADSHLIPAVAVGVKIGDQIRDYVKGAGKKATAVLSFGGTVLNVRPSPVVAAFSSRGPNLVTPQIMKPDVIGPGVNILAAWSEIAGPTGLDSDTRKTQFNIMSALLKAAHPEWSPSAIKSALMTTAYNHDNMQKPLRDATDGTLSNPWTHGAGHVDPHKAMSPGLVYDISVDDYIAFLCALDYTPMHRQIIAKRPNITCSRKLSDPGQLNYPSFSVLFGNSRTVRYTRELTNVGAARTYYKAYVDAPPSVGVKVRPSRLLFRSVGEKKKYTVTFYARKGKTPPASRNGFGSLLWSSKSYQVRSPVSFTWTRMP